MKDRNTAPNSIVTEYKLFYTVGNTQLRKLFVYKNTQTASDERTESITV